MLPLIQFLMVCSLLLLTAIPVAFVVLGVDYFFKGTYGRGVLITGSVMVPGADRFIEKLKAQATPKTR